MKHIERLQKGMGIGGWLTNYKRFNVLPKEQRLIITKGDMEHFESYITEEDVRYIASLGLDHIRLGFDQIVLEESPYKYRTETFELLHKFAAWCKKYNMRLVLNMHKKTYVGEMYYSTHRGTYTSQAKTKKGNRKAEFALRDAEMWSTLMGYDGKAETDKVWKEVLFNQFHDILPGSSLKEVHERAEKSYENAINVAKSVTDNSIRTENKDGYITVFNSLGWERKALIELPDGYTSVKGEETQKIGDKTYALITVPTCGYKSFELGKDECMVSEKLNELVLENDIIRAEFNNKGEMISLINKVTNSEFLDKPSNVFRMYKDMPTFCDAWDVDSFYENVEVSLDDAEIVPEYKGNLISSLCLKKKINKSEIKQRISLKKGSNCIDFETEIDWKETHKLLKVDFNTNIHANEITSEVQFGYINRPTHKNRQYDADRFEVNQQKWSALTESKRGFAVLNDCKYGVNGNRSKLSLTLLKAGAMPDLNADKGIQKFTYSVMPFSESLFDSDVVKNGFELNCPVTVKEGYMEEKSMLNVSEKNIIIDTVKTAEDGSGDIIIRLYESMNTLTKATLNFGFDIKEAYLTNMLEENQNKVEVINNQIRLTIKPFEVVTLRIKI